MGEGVVASQVLQNYHRRVLLFFTFVLNPGWEIR